MKKNLMIGACWLALITAGLAGCSKPKASITGKYDFVVYESDGDNQNLDDNPVVSRYTIEYVDAKVVTDTLKKDGDKYFLDSTDYLVLVNGTYGMMYTKGYFAKYSKCSSGEIDVSMSATYINKEMAMVGISETPLEGLTEYSFVINAWAS